MHRAIRLLGLLADAMLAMVFGLAAVGFFGTACVEIATPWGIRSPHPRDEAPPVVWARLPNAIPALALAVLSAAAAYRLSRLNPDTSSGLDASGSNGPAEPSAAADRVER